ncbi:HEAT repeat domain-containing protein [Embleya sp. NBC_00896]|uniref:HEAT repeat domain-containing protein n=1 Tax=Embleya sp. NBC_00896 TaxID=2975961 RepID=UPI0038648693|nr:HEAT repeat domain-containing protein [Embleya sp. NBC_00896]
MFDPVITSHDALLGLLRSGHGQGARRALVADRVAVLDALDGCVVRDPRAVPATESRSLYYARLYTDLDAGLDGLARHLLCDDDWTDEDADRTALPLAVLGTLARLGRADAITLLRDYVKEGRDWPEALDRLAAVGDDAALDGMLAVVLERGEVDDLHDCVKRSTGMRPWRTWAAEDERVRAIVEQVDLDWWRWELTRSVKQPANPVAPAQTVDQVLAEAADGPRQSLACGRRLGAVAGPEHRGAILAAAWAGPDGARAAALRYLGEQGDGALLDLAEGALAPDAPSVVRLAAAHAIGGLRSPVAVRRARGWVGRGDLLGEVAVRILAGAGEHADGPVLVDALRSRVADASFAGRPIADQAGHFRLCDLVAGIGRLALVDALDLVRGVYNDADSAGLRASAVHTLARIEPSFAAGTAVEALWDCQADTRLIAARHVDARRPEAATRLRRLAGDPAEHDEVRTVARARLSEM